MWRDYGLCWSANVNVKDDRYEGSNFEFLDFQCHIFDHVASHSLLLSLTLKLPAPTIVPPFQSSLPLIELSYNEERQTPNRQWTPSEAKSK